MDFEVLFQRGLFAPEGVEFVRSPVRARRLWVWTIAIGWAVASLVVSVLVIGVWNIVLVVIDRPHWPWLAVAVSGGVVVLGLLGGLVNASRVHRRWVMHAFCLGEEQMWFRGGLLMRTMTAVPYGRIQSVTVSSGPLQRRMGLASLRVNTATGQSWSTGALDEEDAAVLRAHLAALALERGVEL